MNAGMEKLLILNGSNAARLLPQVKIKDLTAVEFSVSSQWGEDGIIEWLIRNVDVANERFVEFGVENFHESNCRFLMQHRNWQGFVIDGSADFLFVFGFAGRAAAIRGAQRRGFARPLNSRFMRLEK
jgi:hypothetical protein